jgi:flagellar export protein FliJ
VAEALSTLIKLAEADVDARKRVLGELQGRAMQLADRRHALALAMAREQLVAAAATVMTDYAAWAAVAGERRRALDAEIAETERQVEAARAAVFEAWRRKRSLELVRDARAERQAAALARAAQDELDELTLDRFQRRSG